ncbi:MAG TPA: MBOAT family O-acyltransferase [Treponemataceae bacterium]|nr:MBOAT family O-acyltransferase [Treponemataceae bacterium]
MNWGFACVVAESEKKMSRSGWRYFALVMAVVTNVCVLLFFKYYGFFAESINVLVFRLSGGVEFKNILPVLHIVLPIGISFYTFKGLSLVFDSASGSLFTGYGHYSEIHMLFPHAANSKRAALTSTQGLIDTLLYISFFPQVASGPIVHATEFYGDLDVATEAQTVDFSTASALIMSGLLKKLVFANYLSTLLVNPVFTDLSAHSGFQVFMAAVGYSSVIYCDFSGYSDMAIGIALLLGFTTPKNFDRPYSAFCIGDFWRRWHISFSMWLRKYLYFKLGGSRHGLPRTIVALFITMLVSGLWHGASWMFVLWGVMQGVALIVERLVKVGKTPSTNSFGHALQVLITFVYTSISWVVFRSTNWKEVLAWFKALIASPHGFFTTTQAFNAESIVPQVLTPLVIILLLVSLGMHLISDKVRADALTIWKCTPIFIQVLFIVVFFIGLSIFSMSSVAPFIYFSF